jgi:type VI secretion system secreted protein Hcp
MPRIREVEAEFTIETEEEKAMPIYMNYGNLKIKGDVKEQNHKDWVDLSSCQAGVGRGISMPNPGSGGDREASPPHVSEIPCTKSMDNASAELFKEALGGEGQPCVIKFLRGTQTQGMQVYLQLTLTNTLVSSYSMSTGGDIPSESFSLNFTEIEYEYTPTDEAHKDEGARRYKYDLMKAVMS